MKERAPKEDIYSIPDKFKFGSYYYNEFIALANYLSYGTRSFSELLKLLKENPIMTVEEYLNINKDAKDVSGQNIINQLEFEYKSYPQKMSRLNQIVQDINSLNEDDENKFKELINESKRLLLKDTNPVFVKEN